MSRNNEWILILFLFLLAAASEDTFPPFGSDYLNNSKRSRFSFPEPASLAGDFHHMVHVMNKVDQLGQMAVNPPKLPEPSKLVNTDALPDLSGLMDMLGPLLNGSSAASTDNRE